MKSSGAGANGGVFITRRDSAPPLKKSTPAVIRSRHEPLTTKTVAAITGRGSSTGMPGKASATGDDRSPPRS